MAPRPDRVAGIYCPGSNEPSDMAGVNKSSSDRLDSWVAAYKQANQNHDGPWVTWLKSMVQQGSGEPVCAVANCDKPGRCGGHVWIRGLAANAHCSIVPICDAHNGCQHDWAPQGNQFWMQSKPGTKFMKITTRNGFFLKGGGRAPSRNTPADQLKTDY